MRQSEFPDVEYALRKWIETMRSRKQPISGPAIQEMALRIAVKKGVPEDTFKGSKGWLARFIRRAGYKSVTLHGEGASAAINSQQCTMMLESLKQKMKNYPPEHVFNMDEVGLFYRLLPSKTYILASEARDRDLRGNRKSKDRVTVVLCTNVTGTMKIPLAIIGKARQPLCFRNGKLEAAGAPFTYLSQSNAWMDRDIFLRWLHNVFAPSVRKLTGHKVLLIMDNAGMHIAQQHPCIEFAFLPPNTTSRHQPIDCGIGANFKALYKKYLLQYKIVNADGWHYAHEQPAPNMLQSCVMACRAWANVTPVTIVRCWLKSQVMPQEVTDELDLETVQKAPDNATEVIAEVRQMLAGLSLSEWDADAWFEAERSFLADCLEGEAEMLTNDDARDENYGVACCGGFSIDPAALREAILNFDGILGQLGAFSNAFVNWLPMSDELAVENLYCMARSVKFSLEHALRESNARPPAARTQLTLHDVVRNDAREAFAPL